MVSVERSEIRCGVGGGEKRRAVSRDAPPSPSLTKRSVIVLRHFGPVEAIIDLFGHLARLPSVEALRPEGCPKCAHLAHTPGQSLGIVGHGVYARQILGLAFFSGVVYVRRYRCRRCGVTIQVLPGVCHPHRYYAAGVILESIRRHLQGERASDLFDAFGPENHSNNWRTIYRWRRDLGSRLFGWLGERLALKGLANSAREALVRLRRLFAEAGLTGHAALKRRDAGFEAADGLLKAYS